MPETPPAFTYSAFYYAEVYDALIRMKRATWTEHTEEDPHDPVIQFYRAFSVLSHVHACRLDHVARELYVSTAQLRSSLIALGALVDYRLATATPAEVDLLADVSGTLATSSVLVKAHAVFATEGDTSSPAVLFEYDSDDDLSAGPTAEWDVMEDDGGVVTDVTSGLPLSLWAGVPEVGDAVYFGSTSLMFNKIALTISVAASQVATVRWEYREDLREVAPDSAQNLGSFCRFFVDDLVGTSNATGLSVTVTCLRTGSQETVVSDYSSGNRITTVGTLGQTTISTNSNDYLVSAEWVELPSVSDGTAGLTGDGDVTWTLPQDTDRRWATDTVGDVSGYWIRARVSELTGLTLPPVASPTLDEVSEVKKTTWSVLFAARQGRRVEDRVGSTDEGTAGQTFTLARTPYMSLVELAVDSEAWAAVDSLLSSASWDRDARLREETDGSWQIKFGDGVNGKIPPASAPVDVTYRIGGDESGNVGAGTITRDRTGNSKLRHVRNPRAAAGWVAQEGTTEDSRALLREAIPASVRALGRAVTPDDCDTLALAFRTADGSTVTVRNLIDEEGAGPKTVRCVCVGPGGIAPTASDLDELEDYFNGGLAGIQRVGGVMIANQRLVASAYVPLVVDVVIDVSILSTYSTGAEDSIKAAVRSLISPLALRLIRNSETGVWEESDEYLWIWDATIEPSLITAAVVTSVSGITSVTVATPAAPVTLGSYELPVIGDVTVNVTVVT